jgi:hypothetical protein
VNKDEAEDIKRHFRVIAEQLRSDVRQVAEGQQLIRGEVDALHAEMTPEFKEVKSFIRLSYAELEHRIVTIESEPSGLRERVGRLESRRAS